jgi:hypothetical protein
MLGVLWIGSRSQCLLDCEQLEIKLLWYYANYQLKYRVTMLKRIIELIHTPETCSSHDMMF